MDRNTEDRFTAFLHGKANEMKKELKYTPRQFIALLGSEGGLATAQKLVRKEDMSYGTSELYMGNRLDLSLEALILESEWIRYFDEELLAHAEKKLKKLNYSYTRYSEND